VVRRWIRLQPRSAQAWEQLHAVLGHLGRTDEALEALRHRVAVAPTVVAREPVIAAQLWLGAGNYVEAERLLDAYLAGTVDTTRIADAMWYRIILYRNQGRLREAADVARQYRGLLTPVRDTAPELWIAQAQVMFESGRDRLAAAMWDTAGRWEGQARLTANRPRAQVWQMTHRATALAAAGDTAKLAALADTMRVLGTLSGDARDQRLHHYVRGLLLAARHLDTDAMAELALAVSSPAEGYLRINLEMARASLRRGRPRDAVDALQPALRGLIEGYGYYVTRTELHEVAARAWEAAGVRDSAVTHYNQVLSAWSKADPSFAPRVADVRQRLVALQAKR
jgi:tetratricopeptide (TPR) repeat protein